MKKLLFIILFFFSVSYIMADTSTKNHRSPSLENIRINGIVTYDSNKDVNTLGLYSYNVTNPIQRKLLKYIPRVSASGGAVVSENKLYTYDYVIDYGYVSMAKYTTYDLTTGEELNSKNMGYDLYEVYKHAATSVAINPLDKKTYCCSYFYDKNIKEIKYNLSIWNLEEMTKDSIARLNVPMRVMAFSREGILYGITASTSQTGNNGGMLVSINTENGNITQIGDTGIKPDFFQSAVIDTNNNRFYWFANEEDESANLYDVDITTGEATKIGELPFADQVLAAYMAPPETVDGAPSAVANVMISFIEGNLNGKISFDMPYKSYDGLDLDGELDYKITSNNKIICSGTSIPGEHVERNISIDESGLYNFIITVSNNIGTSPIVEQNLYIGNDTPTEVRNISLVREGSINRLSWNVPESTVNGGYMDVENLKYRIKRMPDGIIVSETHKDLSFEETIEKDEMSICYYEIEAINDIYIGKAAISNSVIVGKYVTPPYVQDFEESSSSSLFTIIDANNDKSTWSYSSGTMRYRASFSSDANDWLITPPFNLKAGNSYRIKYTVYGLNSRNENKLVVKIGTAPSIDGMNSIIKDLTTYNNTSRTPIEETIDFMPEKDGIYYIGFYISSEKGMGNFTLDDFSISSPTSENVPSKVSSLSVIPDSKGGLFANISFESPSTTIGGEKLNDLDKIEILRNNVVIHSFNPEKAEPSLYEYSDNVDKSDIYIYSVVCSNSSGKGEYSNDTVYVGIDIPNSPEKVSLREENGNAILSWESSKNVGINGGFVDIDNVLYDVFSESGEVLVTDIMENSYEIKNINANTKQESVKYKIKAKNESGTSVGFTESNSILTGIAYKTPYIESFPKAEFSNGPWINETINGKSYDSKWEARQDQDFNNDGGSADFCGYTSGASSLLCGPKLDITELKDPILSFWAIIPLGNVKVSVMVSNNDGVWKEIGVVDNSNKWKRYCFNLKDLKSESLRIAFLGECLEDFNFAYIDNIVVDECQGNDMEIHLFDGPAKIVHGEDNKYIVQILNNGIDIVNDAVLKINDVEDNLLATLKLKDIPALSDTSIDVSVDFPITCTGDFIALYALLEYEKDENKENNKSEIVQTFIEGKPLPVVTDLKGEALNNVINLSWSVPNINNPIPVKELEDFESYEPFGINGFGEWTVLDKDGGETYVFGETNAWPNAGKPQAFMVMDTKSDFFMGLNIDKNFDMNRLRGNKLAVCWASDPKTTKDGHNDDWLISPMLSGKEQTITFEARSYSNNYNLEAFEVYYSTEDRNIEDFTNIVATEKEISADDWSTFRYTLPENAKYFAIRCISENAFILGIDNITYYPHPKPIENLEIINYNIYRNNVLIGENNIAEYTDNNPLKGINTYTVTVVYNEGESVFSEAMTIDTETGFTNIDCDIRITTENGLSVYGTNGEKIMIFNLAGINILTHYGDLNNFQLQSGIYIVRIFDRNIKVRIE